MDMVAIFPSNVSKTTSLRDTAYCCLLGKESSISHRISESFPGAIQESNNWSR